jgi:hypothetical protein
MRPISRYAPALRTEQMQTYTIKSPRQTHTRPATCEEVNCKQWREGWVTTVPIGSPQHDLIKQILRGYAPDGLKRSAKDVTSIGSPNAEYFFDAGSPCFKASKHRKSLERPEFYLVRGGDWRGNTGLIRRHTKPEHWVEDMSETLETVRRKYT